MNKPRHKKISKFLSFVLRDHPDGIGIELDSGGWADASELLRAKDYKNRKQVNLLKGKKKSPNIGKKSCCCFYYKNTETR